MRGADGSWGAATLAGMTAGLDVPVPNRDGLLAELERTLALCRWNAEHLPAAPRRGLPFPDLEGRLEEGHPYHPCFKARLGFDEADHAAFGPETGQRFQLVWLLVARSCLHQAIPGGEEDFWRAELGPDGRVVCLGPLGDRYRASQSLRTVMNTDDPRKADVKLALNIVNTASRRIIEPHSVCTGPVISAWLTALEAGDPDNRQTSPVTSAERA